MSIADIDYALKAGYEALALGLSTAWENTPFSPPADSSDWAAVAMKPISNEVDTLGENGLDMHSGFMQIDFNTKPNKGMAQLLVYHQAVLDYFIRGKALTRNTETVIIESVERSGLLIENGWAKISVSVYWRSQVTRPAI